VLLREFFRTVQHQLLRELASLGLAPSGQISFTSPFAAAMTGLSMSIKTRMFCWPWDRN
jgi:hypothetical protein